MSLHILKTSQKLPIDIKTAWDFLSSPGNLEKITPPGMSFKITSGHTPGDKMYQGMVISYIVKPFPILPLQWVTEITHVNEPNYFVDEQRFGPYSFWHHKHFLKEIEGGVLMEDTVHYKVPLGIIGDMANSLMIKSQLKTIFEFRHEELERIFGKWPDQKISLSMQSV